MNSATTFAPPRVTANLTHAFWGVWRLTFRRFVLPSHWITLAIGLGVLALLSTGIGRGRDGDHYLAWSCGFYVTFLVPAVAFLSAAGVMRDEMKSTTTDYVLTRPVPRPAFLISKYVAHMVCTQIDLLFTFAVVVGLGVLREMPGLTAAIPQMLVCQALLIAAFTAFGFLCAALTGRYIVIGLAYAGIIEAGVGQIPTQISRLSMTHQVRDLLAPFMQRAGEVASTATWLGTTAMLLAFAAFMLTAAATVFTLRELSGAPEA